MEPIFIGNDYKVYLTNLRDADDSLLVGAVVEATMYDSETDAEVAGLSWPIVLANLGSGNYEGIVDKAIEIIHKRTYRLSVVASEGGADSQWDIELLAVYRDGQS